MVVDKEERLSIEEVEAEKIAHSKKSAMKKRKIHSSLNEKYLI